MRTRLHDWTHRRRRLLRLVAGLILLAALATTYSHLMAHLAWRRALRTAGFNEKMEEPSNHDRILIVAPHPDDEALGCAGLILRAIAEGASVDVALMTNGDASELALIFGEKTLPLSPDAYVQMGKQRQRESLVALGAMGVPADRVHFLGFPNNGLVSLWRPDYWSYSTLYRSPATKLSFSSYERSFTPQAPYCGQQVLADLKALLQQVRPTMLFIPHPQDVHPDHWATAAFVRYALEGCQVRGADWARETRVYGYLVHWPRWPAPLRYSPALDLLPPPDLRAISGEPWVTSPLDAEGVRTKARVIRAYRSQAPSFDRLLLSFARRNEPFAELSQRHAHPGTPLTWPDENSRRRGLGGAEVLGAAVHVKPDCVVDAEIWCAPKPLGRDAYVAMDLRTWDLSGRPVIATVTLADPLSPTATCWDSRGTSKADVRSWLGGGGQWHITGLQMPRDSRARDRLFITCWGSVRDRLTDPAPPG
jgi:LmbE family N-acetylglucosaminyl deacetylase